MADDDLWFWLLVLGVAVVAGATAAMRWLRLARLIEDTPTSRIRSAAQGYVEIAGRALPLGEARNFAPLTLRPCIWWRYRIAKKTERGSGKGRRSSWQTVGSGRSSVPFVLDDGTGRCIVKPDGAEVVPTESTTWYGDTPWPAPPGDAGRGFSFGERRYRYTEERIYEHERVYALGDFVSTSSAAERDLQAEAARLIGEWKQDQPALLERFDSDRDGRIDPAEWEQARAAARHAVYERGATREAREVQHFLARPGDGALYLLAALPPGDLVKRYRRRAALAFAGFVAATYALGWLLQNTFG